MDPNSIVPFSTHTYRWRQLLVSINVLPSYSQINCSSLFHPYSDHIHSVGNCFAWKQARYGPHTKFDSGWRRCCWQCLQSDYLSLWRYHHWHISRHFICHRLSIFNSKINNYIILFSTHNKIEINFLYIHKTATNYLQTSDNWYMWCTQSAWYAGSFVGNLLSNLCRTSHNRNIWRFFDHYFPSYGKYRHAQCNHNGEGRGIHHWGKYNSYKLEVQRG